MQTQSILKPPTSQVLKSGQVILKTGEEIGEHKTTKREELIIVLKGQATIFEGKKQTKVKAGQTYFIPEGVVHNVKNMGKQDLEYIYVVSLFA